MAINRRTGLLQKFVNFKTQNLCARSCLKHQDLLEKLKNSASKYAFHCPEVSKLKYIWVKYRKNVKSNYDTNFGHFQKDCFSFIDYY